MRFSHILVPAAVALIASMAVSAEAAPDRTPPVWNKLPTTSMPVGAVLEPGGSWDVSCTYISMKSNINWRASDPESGIDHYGYADQDAWPVPNYGKATTGTQTAYVEHNACGSGGYEETAFYAFNGAGLWTDTYWDPDRLSVMQDDGRWWPDSDGVDLDAPQLEYSGGWSTSACNCWADGTTQKTTKSAASVTLGNLWAHGGTHGVGLVMAKGPDRGKVAIFVDGLKVATVDTYSATKVNRTVVWRQALTKSDDSIKVVNLATPGRPRVDIDAFVLLKK